MLPSDDNRRFWACSGIILVLPIILAAAHVVTAEIAGHGIAVRNFETAVHALYYINSLIAGVGGTWAALQLPGGRNTFNVIASVAAFIVDVAAYWAWLWVFQIYAHGI